MYLDYLIKVCLSNQQLGLDCKFYLIFCEWWFWSLSFSRALLGFPRSVLCMPAYEWAQDLWKFTHRIRRCTLQLSLQDFPQPLTPCSLAHRRLFFWFFLDRNGFLWVSATHALHCCVAPQVGPPLGKSQKREKDEEHPRIGCFSNSQLCFTICLLLFIFQCFGTCFLSLVQRFLIASTKKMGLSSFIPYWLEPEFPSLLLQILSPTTLPSLNRLSPDFLNGMFVPTPSHCTCSLPLLCKIWFPTLKCKHYVAFSALYTTVIPIGHTTQAESYLLGGWLARLTENQWLKTGYSS